LNSSCGDRGETLHFGIVPDESWLTSARISDIIPGVIANLETIRPVRWVRSAKRDAGRLGSFREDESGNSPKDAFVTELESAKSLPFLDTLRWTADGLIPAIVQEASSGEVLMMAWMDEAAVRRTLSTKQTHFYSRSRRSSWHKGETSGHVQDVESIHVDCDADVLLLRVRQVGGACHEGYHNCFWRRVDDSGRLEVVAEPVFAAGSVHGSKDPPKP